MSLLSIHLSAAFGDVVARLEYLLALQSTIKKLDVDGTFNHAGFVDGTAVGPILAATSCQFKFPLTYPDSILATATVPSDTFHEHGFRMEYTV